MNVFCEVMFELVGGKESVEESRKESFNLYAGRRTRRRVEE